MEFSQERSLVSKKLLAPPQPLVRRTSVRRLAQDWTARQLMVAITTATCGLIVVVGSVLLYRAWPLLASYSLPQLLGGQTWQPMLGQFGFAPFIVGSVTVTLTAMAFAVIPAVFSGIYMAEYTSARVRGVLKPLLDLLVGIPSVVYGLWGILFIVPLIRDYIGPWVDNTLGHSIPMFSRTNPSGYGLLAGGFVLAVMVFPLIVAVTEEVLRSTPREMREALLCLGATRWEATRCIVRRRGLPGILAAIVLGFSRAFGETLAVMMVVGNSVQIPHSLFDAAYPLPALIANNYGEMMSVPMYESALMAAALLLLLVVLGFNIMARLIIVRLGRRS